MISIMGRDRTTADPFSMATSGESSSPTNKVLPAQERRHVLPKDLPNALTHLDDEELGRLSRRQLLRRSGAAIRCRALSLPERVREASLPLH